MAMRIGYLDCFSGVAGDMWVGALLDAGLPLADLQQAVAALQLRGVAIAAERVLRQGLAGTRFVVTLDGVEPGRAAAAATAVATMRPVPRAPLRSGGDAGAHGHRGLAEILAIVHRAGLPAAVEDRCQQVFTAIAEVEARAHATSVDAVHFHEVGAEDAIVDVVCACLGVQLLGLERLYASAIAVGSGTVRAAHGVLPVPAPATLDLLLGLPVRQGGLAGERTTPTGAALLRVLVDEFEPTFTWLPGRRGYGAGARDDPGVPNLLRLVIGERRAPGSATQVVELQCQLDTASGELMAWLVDQVFERGAVDAFVTATLMKKGRPGFLLTVLGDAAHADGLTTFLLEESSTLGVRRHVCDRAVLERWQETRPSEFGEVRYKVARLPSGALLARPEEDDVRRLAGALGLPRAEVLRRLLPP